MVRLVFFRRLHTFKPFDVVILRSLAKPNEKFHLSQPLEPGLTVKTGNGPIPHEDIIGRPFRSLISSNTSSGPSQHKYIVVKPSLEEYVVNRRREAQPIYSLDASLIVELSGICVDYPLLKQGQSTSSRALSKWKQLDPKDPYESFLHTKQLSRNQNLPKDVITVEPPQQFLECGTGHGSLTLNILKEIHSGNAFYDGENDSTRGAILHSLDKNEKHMKIGLRNVKHYNHGLYWPDVEFHLVDGAPQDWLQTDVANYYRHEVGRAKDNGPFLNGVFLDMPSPELQLHLLSEALLVDSPIVVFVPSIMQIWDCLSMVKKKGIRLTLVKVYELMAGSGGGGLREWDLRKVSVRETGQDGIVVRPKVGVRTVGGGFIGVFRKLPEDSIVKTWD